MANKTEELAMALCKNVAEDMGVYVVDVSYKKEGKTNSLCFYIDKDGGIGIDECEKFSRAVEEILDREDPIDGNYVLEVSSPGVDRRLTKEREFKYYIGREVDVKLFREKDGIKEFTGTLSDYENKTAKIVCEDKVFEVPIKEAAYIKLSFEF